MSGCQIKDILTNKKDINTYSKYIALGKTHEEALNKVKEKIINSYYNLVDTVANIDASIEVPVLQGFEAISEYAIQDEILNQSIYSDNLKTKIHKSISEKTYNSFLHKIKDFFSTIKTNQRDDLLKNLDEDQKATFDQIENFVSTFNKTITHFIEKKPTHLGQQVIEEDQMQFFNIDPNNRKALDFTENFKSTLAITAYNWLMTRASKTRINSDADINKIIGQDEKTPVKPNVRKLLSKKGTVRSAIVEQLGKDAFKALGFDFNRTIDGGIESKIVIALGEAIVATLIKSDFITQTQITNSRIAEETGINLLEDSTLPVTFLRIVTNNDDEITEELTAQIENFREYGNPLPDLFGAEKYETGPVTEEPNETPVKMGKDFAKAPKKTQKIINKHNKVKHFIKQNVSNVLDFLGYENQLKMLGYRDDLSKVHVTKRESIEAKNDRIKRSVFYINDFIKNHAKNKPFYFIHEVWANLRIGIVSNTVNPQNDTHHRHLITQEDWQVTIDNNSLRVQFMLAAAESLGIDVDKLSVKDAITEFNNLLDPATEKGAIFTKGIEAIRIINSGKTISESEKVQYQENILNAIKKGGKETFSLDGLVALAEYHPTKPFKTNLFREVDGITNGVIIGLIQLVGGDVKTLKNMLNRGGLFFGGQSNSYGEWISDQNNFDSYQDMARSWLRNLSTKKKNVKFKAVETLVGDLGTINSEGVVTAINKIGRLLSKDPLMTTNYGAAIKKIRDNFQEIIIAKLYDTIEENADWRTIDKDGNEIIDQEKEQELQKVFDAVNTIFNTRFDFKKIKDLYEFEFKKASINKLKDAIDSIYGDPLEEAVKEKFQTFATRRTEMNNALRIAFELFNYKYTQAVKEFEKVNKRRANSFDKKVITNDLLKYAPLIKTAMSSTDNNDLSDTLIIMKKSKAKSKDSTGYKNQQNYVKGKELDNLKDGVEGKTKSISVTGSEDHWVDAGVAGVIMGIHALDSAIMQTLLDEFKVLNVFDASGFSLKDSVKGTIAFNKAFFNLMGSYSLRRKIYDTLNRSYKEFVKTSTKEDLAKVQSILNEANVTTIRGPNQEIQTIPISKFIENFYNQSISDYRVRKEILDSTDYITQYNNELGGYIPEAHKVNQNKESEEKYINSLIKEGVIDKINKHFDSMVESVNLFDNRVNDEANIKDVFDRFIKEYEGQYGTSPLNTNGKLTKTAKKRPIYKNHENKAAIDTYLTDPVRYGSSARSIDPNTFNPDYVRDLDAMNTEQVFDELESLNIGNVKEDPLHKLELRKLIKEVISKVIEPVTLKIEKTGDINYGNLFTNDGIYMRAGISSPATRIGMSAQEVMVHELLHHISHYSINNDWLINRELKKLFELVKPQITKEMLMPDGIVPTAAEEKAIEELYDYVFNSDHENALHEFMALGLTNKKFREVLSTLKGSKKDPLFSINPFISLSNIFNRMLEFINNKLLNMSSDITADEKLYQLLKLASGVEARHKSSLLNNWIIFSKVNDATINALKNFVVQPIVNLSQSYLVQIIRFEAIRHIGNVIALLPTTTFKAWYEVSKVVARRLGYTERNLFASIFNEMRGMTEDNESWHLLLMKSKNIIDQLRDKITNQTANFLVSAYGPEGLTAHEKTSITKILINTDVQSILKSTEDDIDKFNLDKILEILKDDKSLNKEINNLISELNKFNEKHYYVKHAESLGHFMVTDTHLEHQGYTNAHNIARLTYDITKTPSGDVTLATGLIDKLATLYALKYAKQADMGAKNSVINTIEREFNRNPIDNGILVTLQAHNQFVKESFEQLFDGNPAQVQKGYIKQITDPRVSFIVAPESDKQYYLDQGYVVDEDKPVMKDPFDPNNTEKMLMYIDTNGGLQGYNKSIVSLTNLRAFGANLIKAHSQVGTLDPANEAYIDAGIISKSKQSIVKNQYTSASTIDTDNKLLIPIPGVDGRITGYRYAMRRDVRENLLNIDYSFDLVMGSMRASIKDKKNSEQINNEVADALYYEYSTDPNNEDLVVIGPNVADPELKELWYLLPDQMRERLNNNFGTDNFYVRERHLDLIFGYRKLALKDVAKNLTRSNNRLFNALGEMLYPILNKGKVRKGESVWTEIVSYAKDAIVIKTIGVLTDNVISNNWLLWINGLSANEIAKYQALALKGIKTYQLEEKELMDLEYKLSINKNLSAQKKKEITGRINLLKHSLKVNPIRKLIDKNVFQSIVEDVNISEDKFTYKDQFEKLIEPISEKTPTPIKVIVKNLAMTHDTQIYKLLHEATQFSDFVARFALYKHQTEIKGLSEQEALRNAMNTFIHYDVPTHRLLQMGNDYGFIMFTKFALRIQHVIWETFKKAPSKVLGLLYLENFFGNFSEIHGDANIITHPITDKINYIPFDVATNIINIPTVNVVR